MADFEWKICDDDQVWEAQKQNDTLPPRSGNNAPFFVAAGAALLLTGSVSEFPPPIEVITVGSSQVVEVTDKGGKWPVWPPEYQQYQNRLDELRQQGYLSGTDRVFYESVSER